MRRGPIPKEYPVHLIRTGARGLPFACDDSDRWRNLQVLYYLNDSSSREHWMKELSDFRNRKPTKRFFAWPESWPERNPLIGLAAFTFNSNHDHLIAWEKQERGVSQFMQKTGVTISRHFNGKYGEQGTVLKPYALRVIDSDRYLQWVVPYVMVKNTFEMHPRGYKWAVNNFEQAWEWAIHWPFSSLGDYAGIRNSPVIDTTRLQELIGAPDDLKSLCRDMVLSREGMAEDEVPKILFFSGEKE